MHAFPTVDPADPRPFPERLRAFLRQHRLPTELVVCAVPSDRLTGRHLRFPFRDRRRLAQAVPLAVEDEVPFDLEGFVVDWEIVGRDGEGARVAAHVAPRAEVAGLLERLREAGLDPRIVEAEGLALANLAGLFDLAGVRVLADLGHRKTTLCLCMDGEPLAARAVALGGSAFVAALARDREIDLGAAEELAAEEGLAAAGPAASAVLDRLAREMVRSLGAFQPELAERGAGGPIELTLLGGGARMPGMEAWLASRVGVEARRLAPPPGDAGRAFLAAGDPALFAPAAALALRAGGNARTRTNFRQAEFAVRFDMGRIGRELRWTAVLAGTALVLSGALAATSIATHSRRAAALESEAARLYGEALPGQPVPRDALPALRAAVASAHDRADFLGVYRGNLSALDLLAEISARVPKELDVVFEELSIERQAIRIRGHSPSFEAVDRLRAELSRFAPFSNIQVSEITSGREGAKSFSVTISLSNREGSA